MITVTRKLSIDLEINIATFLLNFFERLIGILGTINIILLNKIAELKCLTSLLEGGQNGCKSCISGLFGMQRLFGYSVCWFWNVLQLEFFSGINLW